MAAKYKNIDFAKNRDAFKPGTIFPIERSPKNVDERVVVKLNVSEGLPLHEYLRYVVVRTETGFKVDWRESLKLGAEDDERAILNELKLVNPVLEVEVLKVHQSSKSHTSVDIRVTNKSNKLIAYWSVGAN